MNTDEEKMYQELQSEIRALLSDIAQHPLCPLEIRAKILKSSDLIVSIQ